MWFTLDKAEKAKYKNLITNFASLSEAFSQKSEDINTTVAPIVNSKFQETVFQKSFGAIGEDIANTSYDASLLIDENKKYLIGIKSFGLYSGDQKIAQFKKNSQIDNWGKILNKITVNAKNSDTKEQANEKNKQLYKELAFKIATLRNKRIKSSKEQIKGFKGTDAEVESVYHVLMPSKKGERPQIHVGETSYNFINLEKLEIIGATSLKKPTNFKFKDDKHEYKYTSADSQLHMTFNNREIIVESWDVDYIEDPFEVFEQLNRQTDNNDYFSQLLEDEIEDSVSWIIYNKNGRVEENSGFNGFNGGFKLGKSNNNREKRIKNIISKHKDHVNIQKLNYIENELKTLLLNEWKSKDKKEKMKNIRNNLMEYVENIGNKNLEKEIEKTIFRPISEMYIPIPNSRIFHNQKPDFFGKDIGKFKKDSNKLLLPKEKRIFNLEFISSKNIIKAYINQDNGKSIQSYKDQQILGEWILRGVFQLEPREVLTKQKLIEVGINGIRLYKFKDYKRGIGIEFIWIDENNPPLDSIGWVSENRLK
ncbi:hypothetical protein ACXYTD_06075 [Staphylococcus hominis]